MAEIFKQIQEQGTQFENSKGFWAEGFEHIRVLKVKSGRLVLGTDKGLRLDNEDALIFDTEHDAFAVIDGMGGYAKGEEAAKIVGEEILRGLSSKASPLDVQRNAWQSMRKAGDMHESGACYIAGQISGKELKVWYAGDARLLVYDDKGKVKYFSEPSSLEFAPSGRGPGRATENFVRLMNYDRILVASDGLWDNIKIEEAIEEIKGMKVEQALKRLTDMSMERMAGEASIHDRDIGFGNKDNLTILLYEILPVPLRGK